MFIPRHPQSWLCQCGADSIKLGEKSEKGGAVWQNLCGLDVIVPSAAGNIAIGAREDTLNVPIVKKEKNATRKGRNQKMGSARVVFQRREENGPKRFPRERER